MVSIPGRLVALATYQKHPALTPDDRLLAAALAERGIETDAIPWSDPAVDWARYAAVVVRSCWDYHLRPDDFRAWVDALDAAGVRLVNPAPLLRWNADKRYLADLAARGVPIVPTHLAERGSRETLAAIAGRAGWDGLVVKPAVSASAHDTWRVAGVPSADDERRFRALVARGRAIVQPFLPEVVALGEWSLLYFGGRFSHAVLKRARAGDFRVQAEFGGSAEPADPGAEVAAEGAAVLDAVRALVHGAVPVYARVDGCVAGGRFVLMELELIEPTLFLGAHPEAPGRCAGAIASVLWG